MKILEITSLRLPMNDKISGQKLKKKQDIYIASK